MRLIDADELIKELDNDLMGAMYMFNTTPSPAGNVWHGKMREIEKCIGTVMRQPTAYDIEAVVRELEAKKIQLLNHHDEAVIAYNNGLSDAIEIVRGGRNE